MNLHNPGGRVSDLLRHLNATKCMEPEGIHPRVLRELVEDLSKLFSIIYHHSWLIREVLDDWRLAHVKPIHKKGWMRD